VKNHNEGAYDEPTHRRHTLACIHAWYTRRQQNISTVNIVWRNSPEIMSLSSKCSSHEVEKVSASFARFELWELDLHLPFISIERLLRKLGSIAVAETSIWMIEQVVPAGEVTLRTVQVAVRYLDLRSTRYAYFLQINTSLADP
jgi:hypothetical protein